MCSRSLRERKVSAGVSVQALFSTLLALCMASPTPKVTSVVEPYTLGMIAFTIFIRAAGTICKQPSRSSLLIVGLPSYKDRVGGSLDPPLKPQAPLAANYSPSISQLHIICGLRGVRLYSAEEVHERGLYLWCYGEVIIHAGQDFLLMQLFWGTHAPVCNRPLSSLSNPSKLNGSHS